MIKAYLKIRNLLISQKSVRKVRGIVFGVGRKGTPTWHGKIRSSPHFFQVQLLYKVFAVFYHPTIRSSFLPTLQAEQWKKTLAVSDRGLYKIHLCGGIFS